MDSAKIAIQQGGTSLTAEGTEAFVREAMDLWQTLLTTDGSTTIPGAPNEAEGSAQPGQPATKLASAGLSQYDHVFDTVNDQLKIIAHIDGKSKAEQTRKVSLLLLYAHHILGNDHVASELIRTACIDQGCYDSANFAGYLRGLKSSVIMNPKTGGQYDIKLTAPGRKAAKELADQLQSGDE